MIPLTSDTETRPTDAMRAAIAAAKVGDEQRREDPTINLLLERVAALLGKEAALFLPTGTMCNLVAVKTHTSAGDLLLAERDAHVLRAEAGGAGLASGAMTEPLFGDSGAEARIPGTFTAVELAAALDRVGAMPAPYAPPARLLCVEQTHNFGGGSIWPMERLAAVCALARERGLAVHMDGARLLNAAVASGIPASDWCAHVDSAWIDFTKGLGAPIGAVLAGSRDFIARATRYKYAFGGAMRQAGIAAAGCLHALDHHIDRLADDHANATRLATGIGAIPGLRLVYGMPQTNIVFFEPEPGMVSASELARRCLERGLRIGTIGGRIRAVTHLDVSTAQVDEALGAARELASAGIAVDVLSVTSWSELARDGSAKSSAAPGGKESGEPWISELLRGTAGPIIAASDYVRAVPESIRAFVPGERRYLTLGTDGFGRSDTRAALREFFGVDSASIAAAARAALGVTKKGKRAGP